MHHMDVPMDYHVWGTMLEHYQTYAKAGQRNAEIKDRFVDSTEWFVPQVRWQGNCIILQHYRVFLQVVDTDIENSLFKYRVSYRHLTFMIETFELLIKSCEKFDLLFVHIPCATAWSLQKLHFKF